MSSTPAGFELQFFDQVPVEHRPKPLYGNVTAVSRTTGEVTIVTHPSTAKQRKRQHVRRYTFLLSELPPTQASRMLYRAIEQWLVACEMTPAETPVTSSKNTKHGHSPSYASASSPETHPSPEGGSGHTPSKSRHRRAKDEPTASPLGPRVTFLNEADVLAPPPLPPKSASSTAGPGASPVQSPYSANSSKRRHHQRRRASSEMVDLATAVDVGLVWWHVEMHGLHM